MRCKNNKTVDLRNLRFELYKKLITFSTEFSTGINPLRCKDLRDFKPKNKNAVLNVFNFSTY